MMATAFLLIGPVYFVPFETSLGLIQGSMAIIGLSNGFILVSTYGRSQRAAIRNGFNDDMDTYLIISGNVQTAASEFTVAWTGAVMAVVTVVVMGLHVTTVKHSTKKI